MISVRIIQQTPDDMMFILSGTTAAFANTLRRIILSNVPQLAIEDVIIVENNSPFTDEFLAHRLGLIPLRSDSDFLVLPDECDCGGVGCSLCSVTLTLSVETADEGMIVYTRDLESQDPMTVPVHQEIPIVQLGPQQKIILEAVAFLGIGKDHVKFQPVATVGYQFMPSITLDSNKCSDCKECQNACPRNVLEVENKQLSTRNILNCNLCQLCVNACEDDAITVSGSEDSIIFRVESTGGIDTERIVLKAAEILKEQALEFEGLLKELPLEK